MPPARRRMPEWTESVRVPALGDGWTKAGRLRLNSPRADYIYFSPDGTQYRKFELAQAAAVGGGALRRPKRRAMRSPPSGARRP